MTNTYSYIESDSQPTISLTTPNNFSSSSLPTQTAYMPYQTSYVVSNINEQTSSSYFPSNKFINSQI